MYALDTGTSAFDKVIAGWDWASSPEQFSLLAYKTAPHWILEREPEPRETHAQEAQEILLSEWRLPDLIASWAELRTLDPLRLLRPESAFSADLLHFCQREGIVSYLFDAIWLVEECFPSAEALYLELEKDPETDEEWVALNLTVPGPIDQLLDQYHQYIKEWVARVPRAARSKIRLCYDVV